MVDIQALDERVKKIEYIFETGAKDITREIQLEILKDLYQLRETLKSEIGQPTAVEAVPNQEQEQEIKRLKEENDKLKYRIGHLKQHIK